MTSDIYNIECRVGLSLPTIPLAWIQVRGTLRTEPQLCIGVVWCYSGESLCEGQLCQAGALCWLVQLLETLALPGKPEVCGNEFL